MAQDDPFPEGRTAFLFRPTVIGRHIAGRQHFLSRIPPIGKTDVGNHPAKILVAGNARQLDVALISGQISQGGTRLPAGIADRRTGRFQLRRVDAAQSHVDFHRLLRPGLGRDQDRVSIDDADDLCAHRTGDFDPFAGFEGISVEGQERCDRSHEKTEAVAKHHYRKIYAILYLTHPRENQLICESWVETGDSSLMNTALAIAKTSSLAAASLWASTTSA